MSAGPFPLRDGLSWKRCIYPFVLSESWQKWWLPMKKPVQSILSFASLIVFLALSAPAPSALAAQIGDPAAPLSVSKWIKDGPVDMAEGRGKNIYVVEFWATWCGPCRTSIPHLTEMQKKYRDQGVVIIGISGEAESDVAPFVEQMGGKMDYVVALDDAGQTNEAYMEAFRIQGIPHAFVVGKDGNILWEGHPMDNMDGVLAKVVAGGFDVESARKESSEKQARENVRALIKAYHFLAANSDEQDIIKTIRERIVAKAHHQPENLNEFAWGVLNGKKADAAVFPMALKAAERAKELTEGKDPNVLDTYGLALHRNGRTSEGIKVLEEALLLSKDDELTQNIQAHLEEMK